MINYNYIRDQFVNLSNDQLKIISNRNF